MHRYASRHKHEQNIDPRVEDGVLEVDPYSTKDWLPWLALVGFSNIDMIRAQLRVIVVGGGEDLIRRSGGTRHVPGVVLGFGGRVVSPSANVVFTDG